MIMYNEGFMMSEEAEKFELIGQVDKNGHLKVDADVPLRPGKVKIIVFPEDRKQDDDIPVDELLRAAEAGGAFDFWDDPEEDIYTMDDGKPAE